MQSGRQADVVIFAVAFRFGNISNNVVSDSGKVKDNINHPCRERRNLP